MNTNKTKSILLLSLLIAGTAVPFFKAQAQVATQSPKQNQEELSERVNQSRGLLKVIAGELLNQNPKDINHADYQKKIRPFMDAVETRMDSFDRFLEKTLFETLKEDIQYYNSIVHEKGSTPDQIKQTLPGIYKRITSKIEKIKPAYQSQIKSLYEVFADFPIGVEAANGGFSKLTTISGRKIRYQNTSGLPANQDVFENYVLPMISTQCESFTCITYTASDYGNLLNALVYKIDQDFEFVLDDGTRVVIPALHLNIGNAIEIMKNKTYPAWVNDLPIEVKKNGSAQ